MRPTFWILLLLLILWLFGMSYCHNNYCNCGPVGAVVPAAVPGDNNEDGNSLKYLSILDDNGTFNASLNDNLLFATSDCMYDSPISDSLNTFFQNLADYLVQNENRILELSGLYQESENNTCPSDNLGLARAESVQQLLVDQGAPSDQIRLSSSMQNILDMDNDKIMGGISYAFLNGDLGEVEDRLRSQNITLLFGTNQENIFFDEEQTKYFEDLRFFLSRNEDAKALVVGHTDDEGSISSNRRLSRDRANTIKDYMIDQGINEYQITTKGMGPDEPIATNDTEKGKEQNRRVEISIE